MKKNWTPEQEKLIALEGGVPFLKRVAVFADAGAGKTSVLVERVKRLVAHGLNGKRILCVSFTDKSKADLAERLDAFTSVETYTIHGYCARLIREFGSELGLLPAARVLSEDEKDELFYEIFEKAFRNSPPHNLEHRPETFFQLALKFHNLIVEGAGKGEPRLNDERVRDFLLGIHEEFERSKARLGALEYSDLERFAVELLRLPKVRGKTRERYSHVFVDEFQDTSEIQCELVRLLTGETKPLFVVGDPKQSIYRFRGADVKVFEAFARELGQTHRLSSNFRSHPDVIDAVNRVASETLEAYESMVAGKTPHKEKKIKRVTRVESDDHGSGVYRAIEHFLESGFKLSEIVLLMPRLKRNEEWLSALADRGVSVASLGSSSASNDPNLLAFVNLWIWACRPQDLLRAAQVALDFSETPEEVRQSLREVLKGAHAPFNLDELSQAVSSLSCEELLARLDERLGLREKFGVAFDQFALFVQRHQLEGMRPAMLADRLDRLLRVEEELRGFSVFPPPENIAGSIRAFTVHGSKGLEFPAVILADLGPKRARGSAVVASKNALWLLPRTEDDKLDKSDPLLKEFLEAEKQAEQQESARLLYVAMTRAEEALCFVDLTPKKQTKPASKSNESWSEWLKKLELQALLPTETQAELGLKTVSHKQKTAVGAKTYPLFNLPPKYERARIGVTEMLKSESAELKLEPKPTKRETKIDNAADVGTHIHEVLERDAFDELASVENANLKSFLEWKNSEPGKKFFNPAHRAYREFPFEWNRDGKILTGVIDRVVVTDEEILILDYKTLFSKRSKEELLERYSPQLRIYAEAVSAMIGGDEKKIRAFVIDLTASSGNVCLEVDLLP